MKFDVLRRIWWIWSWYLNITDTFCQFCSSYGINDLQSHLDVIRGRWFLATMKGAYVTTDFLLVLNSNNRGPILSRFRDIAAFVRRSPLFPHPTPVTAKISWCFPWCWVSRERTLRLTNREIISKEFQTMSLPWYLNVTDGQTTCCSNIPRSAYSIAR